MDNVISSIVFIVAGFFGISFFLQKRQYRRMKDDLWRKGLEDEIKKIDNSSVDDLIREANKRNRENRSRDYPYQKK